MSSSIMPPQYAFISHSSVDKRYAQRMAEALREDGVWVDLWDMDLGDSLVGRIEGGIEKASEFIIILSRAALDSQWVKLESHMAVIRSLEDDNFRIVAVRIEDCDVPLRFRPFLYVDAPHDPDGAIAQVQEFVKGRRSQGEGAVLYRRHFIDRTDELGQIEDYVADPEVRIICLNGFFGIGKTALVKEAALRLWQRPVISTVLLTRAHGAARLCLELCAAAGIAAPPDRAGEAELRKASLLAAETLVAGARIVVFNHLSNVLDDEGAPSQEVLDILSHLAAIPACSKVPVFVLSRRWPKLDAIPAKRVGHVRVGEMRTEDLVTILGSEASRIQRKPYELSSAALTQVAEQLYGYPLAGRLAAPLLVKYSADFLIAHVRHIHSLRTDIAEAILAQLEFAAGAIHLLELLALFDGGLSADDLCKISERPSDSILDDLDTLADHNVIDLDGAAVRLHPLVSDFYWKHVRSGPHFKDYARRLARLACQRLDASVVGTVDYVNWLTHACRLLLLSGDLDGGRQLRRDLLGELKVACIELYQRQEYDLSLRYCVEYLDSDPTDFEVLFHKARCLSRLERSTEAHGVLDELLSRSTIASRRRARLLYAKGRTYLEQREWEKAKQCFLDSLALSPNYVAALQGVSVVLMRMNMIEDAGGFLRRALNESPMDSYALSLYADVLWRQAKHEEAVEKISLAVKAQPENASFLFRIGRFHHAMNLKEDAYEWFKKAVESDDAYFDARLSLASVAIDLGRFEEAREEIEALRPNLVGEKMRVLQNIEVEYEFATGDVDHAYGLATDRLRRGRDVATLGLVAKIEIALSERSATQQMPVVSDSHKQRARELVEEGLGIEPDNAQLLSEKAQLDVL